MKRIILGIATIAAAASLYVATPAAAQELGIRAGERGVAVTIGDRDRDRGHRHWRDRRHHRADRVMVVRRDRAECRQVTTRVHRPDGSVVIRKRSSC